MVDNAPTIPAVFALLKNGVSMIPKAIMLSNETPISTSVEAHQLHL